MLFEEVDSALSSSRNHHPFLSFTIVEFAPTSVAIIAHPLAIASNITVGIPSE